MHSQENKLLLLKLEHFLLVLPSHQNVKYVATETNVKVSEVRVEKRNKFIKMTESSV